MINKNYTEEMTEYLRKNITNTTFQKLVDNFNIRFGVKFPYWKINYICGINKIRKGFMVYSKEMELFIVEHYPHMKNTEFTRLFNDKFNAQISKCKLMRKANALGIHKNANTYTPEMLNFIKENCHKITRKELADRFNEYFKVNKTIDQINSLCSKRGYSNKRERSYTCEMIEFLRENRRKMQGHELTNAFYHKFGMNVTLQNITSICTGHNILRGFLKYDIGEEYTDCHGRVFIKDKNKKMRLKKECIYEQKNSKVENDEVIIFIDGNNNNFCHENLLKIKKSELRIMTGLKFIKKDRQTTMLGLSLVKLKILTDELDKQQNK